MAAVAVAAVAAVAGAAATKQVAFSAILFLKRAGPTAGSFFSLSMKKRILWLSLALVAGQAGHAFAQNASDALRYSHLQFGGPARTQGIAGANVALGADFGNLSSNPAGLGLFQKSEFHITPGIGLGQSDSRIEGNTAASQNETKNSFHIASLGAVFATRHPDGDESAWRGGALALGFTRLADFNTGTLYQGNISNNQSFLNQYQPEARVLKPGNDFASLRSQYSSEKYTTDIGQLYGAFLADIRKTRAGADSAVALRTQGSTLAQGQSVLSSGSLSQFDIGYGGNYRDRLYIGGAIGFVSSNYTRVRSLTESDNDPNTYFESLNYRTDLGVKGSGINGRLGIIVRALDNVRFGASVQTPTFMRFTETFSTSLVGTFSTRGTDHVPNDLPVGRGDVATQNYPDYAYTINTPFRANGGVAVTLGKHGFITGDVEYVGYPQARLHNAPNDANGSSYTFGPENAGIQSQLQNAVNVRVGAEGRFDVFRLRAGVARYGDPYKNNNGDGVQNFFTAGAGLRQGNFFLDAAAVYTTYNQYYTPYNMAYANVSAINIKTNATRYTTSVTAGITF